MRLAGRAPHILKLASLDGAAEAVLRLAEVAPNILNHGSAHREDETTLLLVEIVPWVLNPPLNFGNAETWSIGLSRKARQCRSSCFEKIGVTTPLQATWRNGLSFCLEPVRFRLEIVSLLIRAGRDYRAGQKGADRSISSLAPASSWRSSRSTMAVSRQAQVAAVASVRNWRVITNSRPPSEQHAICQPFGRAGAGSAVNTKRMGYHPFRRPERSQWGRNSRGHDHGVHGMPG